MVEWKKIGDIAKCYAGATPSTKNASYWEDGIIPWMSSGEVHQGIVTHTATYITQLGYDNSSTKMIPKGSIVIALAGQGKTRGSVAITDIELCTNQSLCGIVLDKSDIINKYVYYFLGTRYNHLRKISSGEGTRGGLNLKMISEYEIPIPAISEQVRIVGILDTFTSSIDNLKQQIAQRRKQYEYYRDQLLDLEGKEGVKIKALETIAEIGTGSSNTQDELEIGKYPFFVRSQIVRWKNDYEYDETAIITSGDGVGVGKVLHYYEGKYALHQRAYRIHIVVEDFVPKFLYYYMQKDFYNYIMLNAYAASVTSVRKPMLLKYPIPVPSLSEQQRIVDILDKFEASIQNLEAQLSQREKQYEYYRNKLLTFE